MPSRSSRPPTAARRADKYELYQHAVQAPDHDVRFLERVAETHGGRRPRVLREDFGGTALVASRWVRRRPDNVAHAIDIDPVPLAWGEAHNRAPLGPAASRLHLRCEDVLTTGVGGCDIVLAPNFSFSCFHERATLLRYFRSARRGLRPGGIFVADMFGGPEAMRTVTERRRVRGFTYEWEQSSYDPITNHLMAHISFRFRDGSALRRAFTYDWRLWGLPEVRDALADAGFRKSWVYWELTDRTGHGSGVLRRLERTSPCDSFVCCVVAKR